MVTKWWKNPRAAVWLLLAVLFVATAMWVSPMPAWAASTKAVAGIKATVEQPAKKGYSLIRKNGSLVCYYNGKVLGNRYICLLKKGGTYQVVPPKTKGALVRRLGKKGVVRTFTGARTILISYKNKSISRYAKNGKVYTGWARKNGKSHFYKNGKMVANAIVGTNPNEMGYVDPTGVRVTAKEMELAVRFVQEHTKSSWSRGEKLKACFDYLWRHYKYQRIYQNDTSPEKMPEYAREMLTNQRGNCYRYATSFAYIARALGYDARVGIGTVGVYDSPHSWAEVRSGNTWYICDASMQQGNPGENFYCRTQANYPRVLKVAKRCVMTAENGVVTWR